MIEPVIVDYGVSNLRSVQRAFERIGVNATISDQVDDIMAANALLLPGVGAFADAVDRLRTSGLAEVLVEAAGKRGTPLLGICLGMQLLAEDSEENGRHTGLGLIPGNVRQLPATDQGLPLPHMGWNEVQPNENSLLFAGIPKGSDFYFVHSYYFQCADAEMIGATCSYGTEFCCAVQHENIMGVQFHPEKSQKFGRQVLESFVRQAEKC
jgi:imidazole glycerol-phosphate synthase subunit HisH